MENRAVRPRNELEQVLRGVSKEVTFADAHLELPSEENKLLLIEFLKEHGYKDETLAKALGYEFDEHLHSLWLKRLEKPLSLMLVSNSTSQIIGASTMNLISLDAHPIASGVNITDENHLKIVGLLTHNYDEYNVFKRYGVDTALRIICLAVHRQYRQKGIGKKLMQATLMFAKDTGLNPVCLYAEASSKASQKIFERFDFEVLHSVRFSDYKYKGEVVFHDTGDSECEIFYVKKL